MNMGMMQEFKDFAVKGNAFDLAIGVVIGAAFGKIVDSLVNDLIMPIVSAITGGVDYANKFVVLKAGSTPEPYTTLEAAKKAGAVTLNYGSFITAIIMFLIIGFVLFMIVKRLNALKAPPAAPATPDDVLLLREIRDALKK
jgi:large conductance mechanosensitive channel